MTAHIIRLVEDFEKLLKSELKGNIFTTAKTISKELEELNTLEVSPMHRYDFVKSREAFNSLSESRQYSGSDDAFFMDKSRALIQALEHYGKINSLTSSRSFNFITNELLREIIKRDYKELTHTLMPDGAWKSAVIISGSILEAILYDQLTSERYNLLALECRSAPKFRGEVKPLDEWKLKEMITVAEKIECLPPQRAKSIDQVLRDYRNFVHPLVEIRSEHPCTQAEALMAQGALEAVCNHFSES